MLTKETEKKLKSLGFDVKALIAAVTNEAEVDYSVPEITSYSDEELTTRDSNAKQEGIKEGKKAGIDVAIKAVAKKLGLDGEFKDPDSLHEAISKRNTEPNEQVKLLQNKVEQAERERDAAINNEKTAKRDAELLSNLPPNRRTDLSDSEYLQLFKLSHEVADEDGKPVVKRGGNILRDDKTQSPLAIKDAINSFFNERKFIADQQQQTGRGDGDKPGGIGSGIKSYSKAEEKWKAENPDKDTMSSEFHAYLGTLAKEPGFNINA